MRPSETREEGSAARQLRRLSAAASPSMNRPRFVALGDLMLDVAATGRAHAASIRVRPGGSAANAAIWASACGAEATVIGRIGSDLAGQALRKALEDRGVRTQLTITGEAPTGTFLVVDGEIRADRGANAGAWKLPKRIEAEAILISGFLQADVVQAALACSAAPWIAISVGSLTELPGEAGIVFANRSEAKALTGLADPTLAALRLSEGRRLACVTGGPAGAVAAEDGYAIQAASPAVYEASARGAGDAFAAAFLVSLAQKESLASSLAEGCRCGALAADSLDSWPRIEAPRR